MQGWNAATISAVAAAVSAALTAVTAIGVFLQVRAAGAAHNGALFLAFIHRYNAQEMGDSLRTLASWRATQKSDNFADAWVKAKAAGDQTALKLNNHRRIVSRYYFDVARLFEAKLISKAHARSLLANNGLNVFYRVCEPMNHAAHPTRVPVLSRTLHRLRGSYGSGTLHGVVADPNDPEGDAS